MQETDHLPAAPADWTAVREQVFSDGNQQQLITTPSTGIRFFRLMRP